MRLTRRQLLAGALGGAGASLLPRGISSAASPAPHKPEVLITICLCGGFDQTFSTDPKIRSQVDSRIYLPYTESDITTVGDTRIGPLFSPFAKWIPKLAIVNGVNSGTVAHPTGLHNILQMRRTYPTHDRLGLGGHLAQALEARPLDQVHFTHEPMVTEIMPRPGGRVLVINNSIPSILRQLHGVAQEPDLARYTKILDRACKDCPANIVDGLLKAMRGTELKAFPELPLGPEVTALLPFAGKNAPSIDKLTDRWGYFGPVWQSIIGEAVFLVEHRLTRTIYINAHNYWDSHAENDRQQVESMAMFAPALNALLQELETRKLMDRVGIVVTSELGRHPFINRTNGKDHFPEHSVVLIGGGVRAGQYGETDSKIVSQPISFKTGRPGPDGRKPTLDDVGATLLRWFGISDTRRLGYLGTPLDFVLPS
jgi:hypothetical protein